MIEYPYVILHTEENKMSKKLIAYFSATGVTKKVALKLAEVVGADAFEIKPAVAYTNKDLDWRDETSRSTIEMKDPASRPEILNKLSNMEEYDVIFVCFPIWWYIAPTIINTFLESYDLQGKRIILCATSGSSGFGKTLEKLEDSCRGAILTEGKMLNGKLNIDEISSWLKTLNI